MSIIQDDFERFVEKNKQDIINQMMKRLFDQWKNPPPNPKFTVEIIEEELQ